MDEASQEKSKESWINKSSEENYDFVLIVLFSVINKSYF